MSEYEPTFHQEEKELTPDVGVERERPNPRDMGGQCRHCGDVVIFDENWAATHVGNGLHECNDQPGSTTAELYEGN